jgi:oligoendopeptidase F
VLEELGIEAPELLNPDRQRSLENQIRLTGYRKSLERLMRLQRHQGTTNTEYTIDPNSAEINALRREYSIDTKKMSKKSNIYTYPINITRSMT